ncbi:CocE/NonD family hydrolase [Lacticaseibacillus paracasei]|uniref:CocE/NonD family hydrolase n=1 Tax=Lacticaseibacillus paracasei TaxID=1597 RepID=UPI00166F956E|nr:CocE/NonD family hydrolase [Lacticaseibacillus paracasei]
MYRVENPSVLPWYEKVTEDYPKARYYCDSIEEVQIEMRDGIKLNTRIFRPNRKEPFNVLFTRNPYPANEKAYEALYLPFVEQGYCLIIQDCRGTGKSEGKWEPFTHERDDGIDALTWIQNQEWIKTVGTFGRSYSAFTQWIVGDLLPSKVKTMILEVFGIDRYNQVYSNGMFREDIYTSWAFANSGVKSNLSTANQYQIALKHSPANSRDLKILNQSLPFYQDYLCETNPNSDYWKNSIWETLIEIPEKINVPVLVTDGWADHHLQGSLDGFRRLRPEIRKQSRIIVTPTDHIGNLTGSLNYPNSERFGFMNMRANLDWFNHMVKGNKDIFDSSFYLMRKGLWLDPEMRNITSYKLNFSSIDSLSERNGKPGQTHFISDPTIPNTWPGGNELLAWITPGFTNQPHGFTNALPYSKTNQSIRFESDNFKKNEVFIGETTIGLMVASSATDTAFAVRLCEHTAEGYYINIKDGISSLSGRNNNYEQAYKPGTRVKLTINLGDIAWEIKEGSSLVVLVASGNFPMYAIHSNHAGQWSHQTLRKTIAQQTVFVGKGGSFLNLPLVVKQ